MKTKIIAAQQFMYDHRTVEPGEEFEAEEAHADLLVHIGRARRPEDEAKSKRSYKRRDMVAYSR